jgi:hypothetical protein
MNEIENKISPWAIMGPMRRALQLAYTALTDAGLDGSCCDSQYMTAFNKYVQQGIAQYNCVHGRVAGIGAGTVNTVIKTAATPWNGTREGTVRRPGEHFHNTSPKVAHLVLVQLNEDGTQMLYDFEGNLIPPINILTIEGRHYAVFDPKSKCGNQRFGFLFVTEGAITQFGVDVRMSADVEKPDKGDFQTVMCNGMLLAQQRAPDDGNTTLFHFDSMTRASSVSSSCRVRVQLVGSRGTPRVGVLEGYKGLDEIPLHYLDLLQAFFVGYEGTDSVREGVICANIKTGAVLEGDYDDMGSSTMGVYTASDSTDAIFHLTVGDVQYDAVTEPTEAPAVPAAPALLNDNGFVVKRGHVGWCGRTSFNGINSYYCDQVLGIEAIPGSDGRCGPTNGPACASCKRYTAANVRSLLLCLQHDKNEQAAHILKNTLQIGRAHVVVCTRVFQKHYDKHGPVVLMEDTIRCETSPHTLHYNVSNNPNVIYEVSVNLVHESNNEDSIHLTPTYVVWNSKTKTFADDTKLEEMSVRLGHFSCVPMKLFHDPGEETDGFVLEDRNGAKIEILFHTTHILPEKRKSTGTGETAGKHAKMEQR